jgi:hypothetical protein
MSVAVPVSEPSGSPFVRSVGVVLKSVDVTGTDAAAAGAAVGAWPCAIPVVDKHQNVARHKRILREHFVIR